MTLDTSRYRIEDGQGFRLHGHDPSERAGLTKDDAKAALRASVERLRDLQEVLYAQDRWAVLLVFQALDGAGKDSTIEHVLTGVNPAGFQVSSFKAPSPEELDHDFLWRTTCRLPERGRIGVFNRSYYEEVLVVRVHPEILQGQRLPPWLVSDAIWSERFESINAFERHLASNGTVVRKFFLNVSKAEQKRRFLARLEDPSKHWKFAPEDVEKRARFDRYLEAYEDAIRHTSTPHAPWYVVPADHKPAMHAIVARVVVETLEGLALAYPEPSPAARTKWDAARKTLMGEG